MKVFVEAFRNVYTPELEAMGFKRKRDIFHKLVNDKVVLVLCYKRYTTGREFTIQFDFWPLCDGYDMDVFMDSNHILHKVVPELKYHNYWTYDCAIEKCIQFLQESLNYCRNTVFQYFQRITDYQSYYECVLEIEETEGLINSPTQEIPYLYLIHYHNTLLALGKYDLALKAKEAEIKQNKRAMDSYSEKRGLKISDHPRYAEYVGKIGYYERLTTLIDHHDFEAINQIVTQNEEYSRECYAKKLLGIKLK